jgi:hypothetical protein
MLPAVASFWQPSLSPFGDVDRPLPNARRAAARGDVSRSRNAEPLIQWLVPSTSLPLMITSVGLVTPVDDLQLQLGVGDLVDLVGRRQVPDPAADRLVDDRSPVSRWCARLPKSMMSVTGSTIAPSKTTPSCRVIERCG